MKSKQEIEQNIDATFNALEAIEEVNVNHFFKHKVLQKIELEKAEKSKVLGWFTPQFQLATLGLILMLNISAVVFAYASHKENTTVSLESFALEYSLNSETNSILN